MGINNDELVVQAAIEQADLSKLLSRNGFFYSNAKNQARMISSCLEHSKKPKAAELKSKIDQLIIKMSEDGYELITDWQILLGEAREFAKQ